jgi:hypothetical protein
MKGKSMEQNAVALKVENMNLTDAMGFSTPAVSQSSLSRITGTVIQEVEDGKVVQTPVFKITSDDDSYLARTVEVRLFAERQKWQQWDSENKTMQKSVLSNSLNIDLKDTLGTFNLGRPSGYIKDFQALPKDQQDLIRSVNRVKVMMGMVKVVDPFYEGGGTPSNIDEEFAFVMDVKNRDSLKFIDGTVGKLIKKKISPAEHRITLLGETRTLPNGNPYMVTNASLGEFVGLSEGDNEILQNFLDYVESSNEYVTSKWSEENVETISSQDQDIVTNIVDVEDFDQ